MDYIEGLDSIINGRGNEQYDERPDTKPAWLRGLGETQGRQFERQLNMELEASRTQNHKDQLKMEI